jgi:hypothetical protein
MPYFGGKFKDSVIYVSCAQLRAFHRVKPALEQRAEHRRINRRPL